MTQKLTHAALPAAGCYASGAQHGAAQGGCVDVARRRAATSQANDGHVVCLAHLRLAAKRCGFPCSPRSAARTDTVVVALQRGVR